jgi:hypothetical protein
MTVPVAKHARFEGDWETLTVANGPACEVEGISVYKTTPVIFRTISIGASLTVRFRGTFIGLKGITGPDSGIVSIQIDERPPVSENQFSGYSTRYGYGGKPLPALAEGEHTVTWKLSPEKPDKKKILAGAKNKGSLSDFLTNPEKYLGQALYAGELMLVGEPLTP